MPITMTKKQLASLLPDDAFVVDPKTGQRVPLKPTKKARTKRSTKKPTLLVSSAELEELDKDKAEMLRGVLERWAPELLPLSVREYEFAYWLPKRRLWRSDWAWLHNPDWADVRAKQPVKPPTEGVIGVAVEIDGGEHKAGGGRHNTDGDRWKTNAYAECGMYFLRFSPKQLKANPLGVVQQIRMAMTRAGFTLPPPGREITT